MIESLTVFELSERCAQETARFLRRESYAERFCLELWRRAVQQRDNGAWAAVYRQYEGLVRRWLGAPPEEEDEDVAEAFARFWHAVDADKFAHFSSLAGALQYLKMCAQTVRLQRARTAGRRPGSDSLDAAERDVADPDDGIDAAGAHLDAAALWGRVREVLRDERERNVIYLSYAIGLTPRDICARYSAQFPDVSEVYRVKGQALGRLRRSVKFKTAVR